MTPKPRGKAGMGQIWHQRNCLVVIFSTFTALDHGWNDSKAVQLGKSVVYLCFGCSHSSDPVAELCWMRTFLQTLAPITLHHLHLDKHLNHQTQAFPRPLSRQATIL